MQRGKDTLSGKGDELPDMRSNFCFTTYNERHGVLFGGGGSYLSKIKLRETYNDLWLFNPKEEFLPLLNLSKVGLKAKRWIKLPYAENFP
mmetsp:Transcript_14673/g.14290  ORF Transcript_14673/g.14290 Transcript_14673/m.14290 type:complete len:90 (+) Transcript_14673:31-300(+)